MIKIYFKVLSVGQKSCSIFQFIIYCNLYTHPTNKAKNIFTSSQFEKALREKGNLGGLAWTNDSVYLLEKIKDPRSNQIWV